MYVLQMLANAGEKTQSVKYFTFFTLFDASGIIADKSSAIIGMVALAIGAAAIYIIGIIIFCKKDMHI